MSEFTARRFIYATPAYKCGGGRHLHLTREAVLKLVRSGDAEWVGRGHKIAKFVRGRVWRKTMSRDGYASHAVMQLVIGG